MKKRGIASIIALLLIICFYSTIQPTKANPMPTNPEITIVTPTNTTYTTNSLSLNIKIATQYDGYYFNSSERRITYSLDEKENVALKQINYSYNQDIKTSVVEASTLLTELTQGDHSLTVYVEYDYDVHVIDATSSVNFSISPHNSFPILELITIGVVITFIIIILAFSKNKRREK